MAYLADAGILFPVVPAGIPILEDSAGILFPADLAELDTVGVADLADAGILFSAVPAGIPIPADPAGILFPADLAEPVTVGVADLADAGILFPAVPAGIPIPADPAGILFPADLAEPVTVGVADLADAGILFPAVPAGIPIPADPAGILFPADLAEPVTVGVADAAVAGAAPLAVPDVLTEPELVAMIVEDEVETVDGIPVYYGVILTILIMRTPGIFFYEEWVDWCNFNTSDGYYGFFPEDGEAQSPVSNCASVTAVEEAATPVRLQQDSSGASVSAADINPGPVMDFLGPPCCRGPMEMEDSRIPDLRECLRDSSDP